MSTTTTLLHGKPQCYQWFTLAPGLTAAKLNDEAIGYNYMFPKCIQTLTDLLGTTEIYGTRSLSTNDPNPS